MREFDFHGVDKGVLFFDVEVNYAWFTVRAHPEYNVIAKRAGIFDTGLLAVLANHRVGNIGLVWDISSEGLQISEALHPFQSIIRSNIGEIVKLN